MEGVDFDVSFAEDCNTEAPTDHRDAERLLGTGSGAGPVSSESVHELFASQLLVLVAFERACPCRDVCLRS